MYWKDIPKAHCKAPGCVSIQYGRKPFCRIHFRRWEKYNDPLFIPPIWNKTHGMEGTATYKSWQHMKNRCLNPRCKDFKNYGGRGISICPEWVNNFSQFLKDMGTKPKNTSLNRIKNDKNYCKENCEWATDLQQARNTRRNHYITHNNETLCLSEWGEKTGIRPLTIRARIFDYGWSINKALTTPARQ